MFSWTPRLPTIAPEGVATASSSPEAEAGKSCGGKSQCPIGKLNRQVSEVPRWPKRPAPRGLGFRLFPWFVWVLPEDDQIFYFSRPFSRASECHDQGEGRPLGIAGNGTSVSSAVNFF